MNYFKMVDNYEQQNEFSFTSYRGLTMTEDVFSCHFPTFPVLPGVLMLEMIKQTIEQYFKNNGISNYVLVSFDMIKFQKFARPGDILETKISIGKKDSSIQTFSVMISSAEKKIASVKSVVYRTKL